MLKNLTRWRLIGLWFSLVLVASAVGLAFGDVPTTTTSAMLALLSIVPAVLVLVLWPGVQPATVGEILRGER